MGFTDCIHNLDYKQIYKETNKGINMDRLVIILFLVLWGIVMKALIKPSNKPEPYIEVLFWIGLILVIPYIVFILLGGENNGK